MFPINLYQSQRKNYDSSITGRLNVSGSKGTYIGLTLKEYFQLNCFNKRIEEIQQESNESITLGTPTFNNQISDPIVDKNANLRSKNKSITQPKQDLFSMSNAVYVHNQPKLSTLNLEQLGNFDKNAIKLPSIHEQRNINKSRNCIIKDFKAEKKERLQQIRTEENQSINLIIKKNEKQQNDTYKNLIISKKVTKSKIASTTFYQVSHKDRERMKTEQQIPTKNIDKSFIITRYAPKDFMKGYKLGKQETSIKKYQNSFKLTNKQLLKNIS